MFAITSLLAVVVVSLLVTRIATVILVATGMPSQSARFQARSAFTGAGFTTSESEQIVDHPIRRKVVMWLMLLGNAGVVAAASTLILGFRQSGAGAAGYRVLELVAGMTLLLYVSKSAWVDRRLTAGIGHVLRRYTDLPTRDRASLLELADDYAVSELAIEKDEWVADRALADLALREEGLIVLAVGRPGGSWLSAPSGSTVLHEGDTLIIYGRSDQLSEVDNRPAGADGDAAHRSAVSRYDERRAEEEVPAGSL